MKKKLLLIVLVLLSSLALTAGTYYLLEARKSRTDIPENIQKQLTIIPFIPSRDSALKVDRTTYKYDPNQKGLSFIIAGGEYGELTVSEQPTPQEFIDIPDFYPKLVDNFKRYASFESQYGTVYLTRPNGQLKGQTAVMNGRGVLLFIRSQKDLAEDQWRQLFNIIEIGK